MFHGRAPTGSHLGGPKPGRLYRHSPSLRIGMTPARWLILLVLIALGLCLFAVLVAAHGAGWTAASAISARESDHGRTAG